MNYAEDFASPVACELGENFLKKNDFQEIFYLRWASILFYVFWGKEVDVKVLLKVYRTESQVWEFFLIDTNPYEIEWNFHKRLTSDFYLHPFSIQSGKIGSVRFAYIVHFDGLSIPSEFEYEFMDASILDQEGYHKKNSCKAVAYNTYCTQEVDASLLQHDVDWLNQHFDSLHLTPKFTKGCTHHPYHPKRYIHDQIDCVIEEKRQNPDSLQRIKVCVDCIDDTDFIQHLIYAHSQGVYVQCIVDWRKMCLTNRDNYFRLKQSGIELLGIFCTPKHPMIEVAPDMHNKFIIFGKKDCILGSFNINFDRWGANWESGMTFHSYGVCRLLDNIFQSVRGGAIQPYKIDPQSPFNLLYTFGLHHKEDGQVYLPHHAILSSIREAKHSIKACLFLIGELQGELQESIVDALVYAHQKGCSVQIIFNGHLAREGDPGKEYTMQEELQRPLLPAIQRLKKNNVPFFLVYDHQERPVPYSPLHSKYCIIDNQLVLEGSFNWYNTSIFSHDLLVMAKKEQIADCYLYEFHQILDTFLIIDGLEK